MTGTDNNMISKMTELEKELQHAGLWQRAMPAWVLGYDESTVNSPADFAQWLQFVFIPNHLEGRHYATAQGKKFIVPAAIKFFGNDLQKGKLLQVLIEIDSLL
jgi:uncharacterized protein YqcC (DUF446 family)